MKKILAVSGGVDSMVMLDLLCRDARGDVVVGHFDHGIRENSGVDADFVRRVAGEYGVEFRVGRGELGSKAGEALARRRRYEFLFGLADECGGEVYVAHHRDDLVESVVINLLRGTGWRGLAPMMGNVRRPLLGWGKKDIHWYAAEYEIRWRQDPTNTYDSYLRNRVRERFVERKSDFLLELSLRQREIAGEVDGIIGGLLPGDNRYMRGWFRELDTQVGMEILRAGLGWVGRSATRPQLVEFLAAVRNYGTGKAFNLGGDYLVRFRREDFVLE